MSLQHAILTALLEKPTSGLELARRFDRSIRYFWTATHQQIYRELRKLETSGLICEREELLIAQGHRKTYEVLAPGRNELTNWVASTQDPRPLRDPLLLRVRAAATIGVEGLSEELERHLAQHRQRLTEYMEIEDRDFTESTSDAVRLQHLVLRAGVGLEAFWVEWLTQALETVREIDSQPGSPAPRRT